MAESVYMRPSLAIPLIVALLSPLPCMAGEDLSAQLKSLAKRMAEAEEKLRQDRHDNALQLDQKSIEGDLADIVSRLEKSQGQQQNSPQQQQQRSEARKDAMERLLGNKQGNKPATQPGGGDKTPPERVPPGSAAARVEKKGGDWAKLPPAARDEMLQAYAADIPPRWRKRIEAYFVSIAAEEANKQ